ncbi:ATP-dependent protease ATPase subunit HslU [Lujinxingia vulgaris]|uniref:ATP-dependent protease ATPase subunit HslU n=1 Tax=Lujinxingia vulgaris TaxID=2600176 RepID=A0A5C6XI57_9DELT|nr:ATP-dependent protease ATPase subunit HslU [Lujinxingia vulgaris]TXD39208.1 ATP-dependent protease ATPase subunit HslU [Lujinxingia vulgaris]
MATSPTPRHDDLELTPRQIVAALDRYIVGQHAAKRAVAVALRNRWRRQQLDEELRDEIMPKNIIMIGPTGVGKTEIARRLARLARAPFLKVEASKFTEVGYVGRDVESMVRDLLELGINLVKAEAEERVEERAREIAEERILDQLELKNPERPPLDERHSSQKSFIVGEDGTIQSTSEAPKNVREHLRQRLRQGDFDDDYIEIELTDSSNPVIEVFSGQKGMEEMDLGSVFGNMFPRRRKKKRVKVKDALGSLVKEEAGRLIDMDQITQEALQRTQQSGIIFLDEIDKIAGRESQQGPDVSREGVQRDLLPIVEGSSVTTKHGVVKTDHILFIAAGAFHVSKPSDLIPELQGRFPIRVELESLTQQDFQRILTEPRNSLTRQYIELMSTEGITVSFDDEAIGTIAEMAYQVNETLENIGARRLHTIMEKVFEALSFDAPEIDDQDIVVSADYVRERLQDVLQDEDLSRYIL